MDYFLGYEVYEKSFATPRAYTFNETETENGWTPPLNTYSSPDMKCFTIIVPFQRKNTILAIDIHVKTEIFPEGLRPNIPNEFTVIEKLSN